jgi:DNA-binding HxlR family transcriptional regulator
VLVRESVLDVLGRRRALDILDFLDGQSGGARFKEVQEHAANGVPSVAAGLLSSLGRCGAIARDEATGIPRYRLTEGGRVARGCLHQVLDALEKESRSGVRQRGRGASPRFSRPRPPGGGR